MQNFGKFKKISAQKKQKTDNNKDFAKPKEVKFNAYLLVLAKHNQQIRDINERNKNK